MRSNDNNNIIIYQDENGVTKVNVRFADEDVWLTQNQLAKIYDTSQQNIALHIKNIYADGELNDNEATHKDFLLVRQEGNRKVQRNITHYNLYMIIVIGKRVQSEVAAHFSSWAKKQLSDKGKNCDLYSRKSLSKEEIGQIKARNNEYWKSMTAEASEVYKCKMKRLSDVKGEEETRLLKDFRRDDSYNGNPAPHHIIYKLGNLFLSKDGCRAYEFLIEYDIYEPNVGIYYGCKGLTLKGNHNKQIENFNKEWEKIRDKVAEVLTNTFPGKNFTYRFKCTDNANNNTYWPFWITLNEDEDIVGVAVRALRIIKEVYKKHFDLEEDPEISTPECENAEKKEPKEYNRQLACFETVTAFSESVYQLLLKKLRNDSNEKIFKKFIISLTNEKGIHKNDIYEKAYAVDFSGVDFAYLIVALFNHFNENSRAEVKVPWEAFTNVFLNMDDKYFGKDTLKNSYKKNGDENDPTHNKHLAQAKNKLLNLL